MSIDKAFQEADKDEKKIWVTWLNNVLDELRDNDFFGTEGQNDPRGDNKLRKEFRNRNVIIKRIK